MTTLKLTAITIAAASGPLLFAQDTTPAQPPKTMAAAALPQFEVATIKRSQSSDSSSLKVSPGGQVNVTNFPIMVLLQFAYDVPRQQISGGPSWLDHDRFDIVANPDTAGTPNMTQLKMMLRKLLADRLLLALHRETKELSVYALTVAKGGPSSLRIPPTRMDFPHFWAEADRREESSKM